MSAALPPLPLLISRAGNYKKKSVVNLCHTIQNNIVPEILWHDRRGPGNAFLSIVPTVPRNTTRGGWLAGKLEGEKFQETSTILLNKQCGYDYKSVPGTHAVDIEGQGGLFRNQLKTSYCKPKATIQNLPSDPLKVLGNQITVTSYRLSKHCFSNIKQLCKDYNMRQREINSFTILCRFWHPGFESIVGTVVIMAWQDGDFTADTETPFLGYLNHRRAIRSTEKLWKFEKKYGYVAINASASNQANYYFRLDSIKGCKNVYISPAIWYDLKELKVIND